MLVGEEAAAAAVATLYLICYQQGASGVAGLAGCLPESCRRLEYAGYTLDAFHNQGGKFPGGQMALEGVDVVQGSEDNIVSLVEGGLDGGIVGGCDGSARAAVECLADGQDFLASGLEGSSLEGVFVGLGTAVAQEQRVVGVAALQAEFAGQLHLQRILHRVGVKTESAQLPLHHLHIDRVTVSDGNHGVASVKVEVFRAFLVPDVTAAALYRLYRPQFICLE